MKRLFDITLAFFGAVVMFPFMLVFMWLIWRQDHHSPLYVAERYGLGRNVFKMFKLRSMCVDADKSKVDSTSSDDPRVTKIGYFVRKYKLDELPQLWNVLLGNMSFVGPRPNLKREVDLYTEEELKLLSVKPGITDLASIVFSDLGEILQGEPDANIAYNQLVRPWKNRLGLLYVEKSSLPLDCTIIVITIIGLFSRTLALKSVNKVLLKLGADAELVDVALRNKPLFPHPPIGAEEVVFTRGVDCC